jgi:hypothetical protein
LHWEKVTITYDNPEGEPDITYEELEAAATAM